MKAATPMMTPLLTKLTGFAGKRRRVERRAFRRLTPGRLTPCQVRPPGESSARAGLTHNLSLRGAGILTDREYAPGTRLGLLFVNAAHTFALALELEVVRCFRVVNGEYFIGGRFDRQLRHDELIPFLV